METEITVEVVCALPGHQHLVSLRVPADCTAAEAVERSGIARLVPQIDTTRAPLGIFGRLLERPREHVLADGDRVEIYRPLTQDPRAARRARSSGRGRR